MTEQSHMPQEADRTDQQEGSEQASSESMGEKMMRERHQRTLWVNFAAMLLGIWLASSPWLVAERDPWLTASSLVSGLLIIGFGMLSLSPERGWARWANCAIGIWLLVAPLIFWAPTAAAYATSSFIGAWVIALSILIPGMPGMRMMDGPDMPPGWSYNPSSWLQRAPVIALGFISFFVSRYLAARQLGHTDHAWDPFFGNGTERILHSSVSRAWPVSDAGFGAFSYMLESLSGFMGGHQRWRTMPWMVLMFALLVIPLGITSIILVILQPVMVGTWCTFCLITAFLMLLMIPLAVDEVVGMGQFMLSVKRAGNPLWINFWKGGTMDSGDAGTYDEVTGWHSPKDEAARASVRGVTVPLTLLASAFLGFWLMGAPVPLGATGFAANSDFLVGPLIAVVAVCAMAEVIRAFRYVNIVLGLWLIAAPWFLAGATAASTANDLVIGLALIALSIPRGPVLQRYAGWQRYVR